MKTESEILRFVDTIHRDKEIDKEMIFQAIEAAYLTSVKKKLGESETLRVDVDRETGAIRILDDETELEVEDLGRIAASTGKQVLFQKIREAERDVIYEEYIGKVSNLVSGVVQRLEGPNMVVSLGKVEGFLPRSEQAPGERFRVGERIKVLIQEIVKNGNRVRIVLSRTNPGLVRTLFELEVPEIADKTIEIKGIAREPGYRTKVAVTTYDPNVDCVGACVGVRGSRIKNIVDELFGEKIDIVRWNESIEVLIMNALKPAEISTMDLDFETKHAKVYVKADQQSIAIGKRGQNVRLAAKMAHWEIDIFSVTEEQLEQMRTEEIDEDGQPIAIGVLGDSALEDETNEASVEGNQNTDGVTANDDAVPATTEDDAVEDDAVEDDAVEDDVVEDDAVEDNVVEDDAVENNAVENNVVENNVVEDNVVEDDVVEDDVIEDNLSEDESVETMGDPVESADREDTTDAVDTVDAEAIVADNGTARKEGGVESGDQDQH